MVINHLTRAAGMILQALFTPSHFYRDFQGLQLEVWELGDGMGWDGWNWIQGWAKKRNTWGRL